MVKHLDDTLALKIMHPDAKDASMKVLVGETEGWEDHVMRVVEVEVNGYTPRHMHPWPHINYVIDGVGHIMIDGVEHPVKQGSYAFVPANTIHQFVNKGDQKFKFICIVPKEGHK